MYAAAKHRGHSSSQSQQHVDEALMADGVAADAQAEDPAVLRLAEILVDPPMELQLADEEALLRQRAEVLARDPSPALDPMRAWLRRVQDLLLLDTDEGLEGVRGGEHGERRAARGERSPASCKGSTCRAPGETAVLAREKICPLALDAVVPLPLGAAPHSPAVAVRCAPSRFRPTLSLGSCAARAVRSTVRREKSVDKRES